MANKIFLTNFKKPNDQKMNGHNGILKIVLFNIVQ